MFQRPIVRQLMDGKNGAMRELTRDETNLVSGGEDDYQLQDHTDWTPTPQSCGDKRSTGRFSGSAPAQYDCLI